MGATLRAGDIVGRYRIEDKLGEGGMGAVYRAQDEQLRRSVALKVLTVEDGGSEASEAEWHSRMLREARAAASFDHPNAVSVYDFGEHEGRPFLVMELVRGRTLRAFVGDEAVPLTTKLRWLADMASGLDGAHVAGLVHRDIKPDNVMVRDGRTIKILDFGIARRIAKPIDESAPTEDGGLGTLTGKGAIVGTPAYMAPEQLRLRNVDGRADQFAWGVVAYELLSGKRPFAQGGDALSVAAAVLMEEPTPLRKVCPEVPGGVSDLIERALSKAPDDRFASMREIVERLWPFTNSSESAPSSDALAHGAQSAHTAATAPRATDGRRTPILAGALVLAVVGVSWVALQGDDEAARPPSSAIVATSAAMGPARSSASTFPSAPSRDPLETTALRAPCEDLVGGPSGDRPAGCSEDHVAWCDAERAFMVCCAPGLAATPDGVCACPPGGTGDAAARASGCPAPSPDEGDQTERLQSAIKKLRQSIRDCYERGLENNPAIEGRVAVAFVLNPEGYPFQVRVVSSAVPDPEMQRCITTVFRNVRMLPPIDGHVGVTYPFVFKR